LESFVSPRDLLRLKQEMSLKYADMVYNGVWYSPVREAIDALVANIQERVTGVIRVKLFKGSSHVVGRKSPYALYDHGLATYDEGDTFDHGAAVGFIKIYGLPIEHVARKWGLADQHVPLKKAV
jgi:argininosuccinate synthase